MDGFIKIDNTTFVNISDVRSILFEYDNDDDLYAYVSMKGNRGDPCDDADYVASDEWAEDLKSMFYNKEGK